MEPSESNKRRGRKFPLVWNWGIFLPSARDLSSVVFSAELVQCIARDKSRLVSLRGSVLVDA